MEDYPELVNNPDTPDYDELVERAEAIFSAGLPLTSEEAEVLLGASPEFRKLILGEEYTDAA